MISSVIPSLKIFLLWVLAHVDEWQHGDGGLIRKREAIFSLEATSSRWKTGPKIQITDRLQQLLSQ